uniref:Large ribosomal subunit protein uL22c n=1 Tax=Glinus dahomensis TaxID=2518626 RepID=A0A411L6T8_9CARY|nr:ribosomal protein L22 [Glinus dahomensis]
MLNNVKIRERDRYELYTASQMNNRVQVYAVGQYISMSPDKARRVIDQIRGRSYEEALMILELMPYRACYPIFKLIYSAAANASHNKSFNKGDLIISKAEVNKGTNRKKLKPRARGRSYLIKKPTCHITIVVKNITYLKEWIRLMKTGSIKERQEVLSDMTKRRSGIIVYNSQKDELEVI